MGAHTGQGARPGTASRPGQVPPRGGRALRLLVTLTALAVLTGGLALAAPRLMERLGVEETALPWGPDCSMDTAEGPVSLSHQEARLATTAVALQARGTEAPDTPGIDAEVLRRLGEGPAGAPGPSLTCRASASSGLEAEELTASGLTPRAERLLAEVREVFGEVSVGGFEPGGVDEGHGENSTHYEGRAIDVFYRPVNEENRRAGWLLAHWLVAHAEEFHVSVVIFDDRIWSVRLAAMGWRPYSPSGDPDNEILRHLDHVHVDVQRGDGGDG